MHENEEQLRGADSGCLPGLGSPEHPDVAI